MSMRLAKCLTSLVAAAFLTSAAVAQETTPAEDAADTEQAVPELALGEAVLGDDAVGQTYVLETHGVWEVRCVRTGKDNDPCQLYQLLKDESENSVAEISMFGLPEGQQAIAGASIATPLETLLTQQITLTVDGGTGKRYPFSYCSVQGCYARIGLTEGDLAAFRRGAKATLTIVPIAAPKEKVNLEISLSGFTAGFASVLEANKAAQN